MINPGKKSGQALILALTVLSIMLIVGTVIIEIGSVSLKASRRSYKVTQCSSLAEAGIDYGIRQLNLDANYTGTSSPIPLSIGEFEVSITGSGITRELTSTSYIPNKVNFEIRKRLRVDVNVNNININFPYGVQAGEGGIYMEPNSQILGDVYTNGSIQGSSGNSINGTAIIANGSSNLPDIEWTSYNSDLTFGQSSPQIDIAQSFIANRTSFFNKLSLYLRKVGSPSDISFRIFSDLSGTPNRLITLASGTLSSSRVTNTYSWIESSLSPFLSLTSGQKYWLVVDTSSDNSDYWQIGFDNTNSYINNESLTSSNWSKANPNWNNLNGDLNFKVWLGTGDTYIQSVNVTQDLYAHSASRLDVGRDFYGYRFTGDLSDHDIGRNAYAEELYLCRVHGDAYADTNICWVDGIRHSGSGITDRSPADYPITQANIDNFKESSATNVYNGDYTPAGIDTSLGPIKINGDLILTNNQIIRLTGTVYVTGSIQLANNNIISLDESFGPSSGIIMTDQQVNIANNVQFLGNSNPNTYILLISNSNLKDVANPAVDVRQNVSAAIIFAPQGIVKLSNNVSIKETTGWKLYLSNNSQVIYESALQNILFSSGPAGGWRMKPGSWREIRF